MYLCHNLDRRLLTLVYTEQADRTSLTKLSPSYITYQFEDNLKLHKCYIILAFIFFFFLALHSRATCTVVTRLSVVSPAIVTE